MQNKKVKLNKSKIFPAKELETIADRLSGKKTNPQAWYRARKRIKEILRVWLLLKDELHELIEEGQIKKK